MGFDIYIEGMTPSTDTGSGIAFMTFGNYRYPLAVRGIYKLVMRFTKCFMTPKGSDLSDPEYGTTLMSLFNGNLDPGTLAQLATQAVQEASETLGRYDVEYELDDDERLGGVSVDDLLVDESAPGVEIRLSIYNVDGTKALFSIPSLFGAQ